MSPAELPFSGDARNSQKKKKKRAKKSPQGGRVHLKRRLLPLASASGRVCVPGRGRRPGFSSVKNPLCAQLQAKYTHTHLSVCVCVCDFPMGVLLSFGQKVEWTYMATPTAIYT